MYIAKLFNQNTLFQGLGGWMDRIDPEQKHKIEAFLFRATSAYLNLYRMRTLSAMCVEQFQRQKDELTLRDEKIVFWSPTLVEFLNEWSPFMSAMGIMQNMILPLVAVTIGVRGSLPSSLADAMKKPNRYGIGEEASSILRQYWIEGGAELRDYRDID